MPDKLDRTFGILADATRREIVMMLARRPHRAAELFERFRMTQPAVSRHLRLLRQSGLVDVRAEPDDQRAREYALRPEALRPVERWLEEVTTFWKAQLDSFARYVEGRQRPGERPRRPRHR